MNSARVGKLVPVVVPLGVVPWLDMLEAVFVMIAIADLSLIESVLMDIE